MQELHEPLRRHYLGDPSTHVIVERRAPTEELPARPKRAGRRLEDPRNQPPAHRVLVPARPRDLPPEAIPHQDALRFVLALDPAAPGAKDLETVRLVSRFQTGDVEAFNELYRRHYDRIYGYIRMALRDLHQVEDVAQEVFRRAFQALPRYEVRAEVPFFGWLMAIARGEVIRAAKQRHAEPRDPAQLGDLPDLVTDGPTPHWLTNPALQELVESLPERQQQALILRYAFDLSGQQIADIMQTTDAAQKSLRKRALTALYEAMVELGYEPSAPRTERFAASRLPRLSPVLSRRRSVGFAHRGVRRSHRACA